jgi:hypothetical protein
MSNTPPDRDEPTRLMMHRPDTAHLRRIGGSRQDRFNDMLIGQTLAAQWESSWWTTEERAKRREATLLGMAAFKPQDEVEGLLAAQAMMLHGMAMELGRRAMLSEQPGELAAGMRKGAVLASRAFVEVTEALERRRGKGRKQSIVVKHMHLSGDARAMIGNFGQGGGGDGKGIECEPHAPPARLAHDAAAGAVLPALLGTDPEREALPGPGDPGQEAMQDARRRIARPKRGRP